MDLRSYVENLGRELAVLVEGSGQDAEAKVERVTVSLQSAIRLTLLDALSAAADEITRDLAPGSVELRMRGRDPNFVVTPPPPDEPLDSAPAQVFEPEEPGPGAEDAATARINFRLPEQLKSAIEEAAAAEGRSVNAWLVRITSAALRQPGRDHRAEARGGRGAQRYTGWVR
ncbi:Arc family DNA-binding protein [Allokutzneria sp. A3M-2-11 16]|uniref:Arc family DNA-binding protein n=1 Tax=Allokutzneria sp. A3M-2-11 16 TaxID=2962043 RepID=UPI0020B8FD70|nr:Arc family DNA-binding protein [Allokutzneria sp. A3M-2-11 16]MCP3805593.1 Arc family DNA-binding protein [Allokutzneria sp. A3M-2-11 16]